MDSHLKRFTGPGTAYAGRLITLVMITVMSASCNVFPRDPVEPDQLASCGPTQPSTRESLIQWVSMTMQDNPDLNTDVVKWIQMTQKSGEHGQSGDRKPPDRVDVEPSAVFGMATITVFPVGNEPAADEKTPNFECNGLVVHAKVNSRVVTEIGSSMTEAGFVNLDSGPAYLVIPGRVSLKTRVKADFPGNAFWEPMAEDFILSERIPRDGRIKEGESCSVFVLGSERKDELTARREPDRSVVPELVTLMHSAPSRYTRGLAAIHLGIIRDSDSIDTMLEAFAAEKDENARADIAIGLGILGDKTALGPIEEAAKALTGKNEFAWKYREAANRLKGQRR